MRQTIWIVIAWVSISILALYLRLNDLSDRPMHADEATGARILANHLNNGDYNFNPQHFHGPLLTYTAAPLAQLRGESNWQALTPQTLRLAPAIAGYLLILTPLIWAPRIGHLPALAAGLFLASSPLLVYYNRIYIHESLLTLLAMITCGLLLRFSDKPRLPVACTLGIFTGMMFATKETFIITIMSWSAAGLSLVCFKDVRTYLASIETRKLILYRLILVITFIITSSFFYSSGFTKPAGIIDAVRTYFVYETTAGHEKPFYHYAHLLLWPKHTLGTWWSEGALLIFMAIALCRSTLNNTHKYAIMFVTVSLCAHCFIYAVIAYKTPWLALVPWAHACILAGFALMNIRSVSRLQQSIIGVLICLTLSSQTWQSLQASNRFANYPQNPYAYVPTSKDVVNLENWLDQLTETTQFQKTDLIAVVGQMYWPLPWYLRNFEQIGYWDKPVQDIAHLPLLCVMPEHTASANKLLEISHTPIHRTLRTNVHLTLYLRNDIWQQWQNTPRP